MAQIDRLGRENLVAHLTKEITSRSLNGSGSKTIALVGAWGSGKSWVLEETTFFLSGVTRQFNPWLYSDELGLFRGFAALILERIKDRHARRRVAKVLDYIGPSMKGFGFDISGSVAAVTRRIRGMGSPAEIRAAIEKAVGSDQPTSYIIVDDLDRLTPDELLTVFKLLRLVGDLPGLVYVLAYDEETLLRLMMRTDITFNSMARARSYLEKIVETKVSIPALSDQTKRQLVLGPILELGRRSQRHFEKDSMEAISWKVESLIFPKLSTVRLCERFLATVSALPEQLFGELNYLDWVLLSYLKTAEPHAFQTIQKYPAIFLGTTSLWSISKEKTTSAAKRIAVELVEESSNESHSVEILELVDELFPKFAATRAGQDVGGRREDQGISSEEYFSLYFDHGLPKDAVSDVQVELALAELDSGNTREPDSSKLEALIAGSPHAVLQVIGQRWARAVAATDLFDFLSKLWWSPLIEYTSGTFGLSGKSDLRVLSGMLLPSFSEDDLNSLFAKMTDDQPTDSLLFSLIVRQGSPAGSAFFVDWVQRAKRRLVELAVARLERSNSPLMEDADALVMLGYLRHLNKPQSRLVFVEAMRSGHMRPSEVAAALLRRNTEFDSQIVSVSVDDDILDDAEVMAQFVSSETTEYPAKWDEPGAFIAAVNESPRLDPEAIANYLITGWREQSRERDKGQRAAEL